MIMMIVAAKRSIICISTPSIYSQSSHNNIIKSKWFKYNVLMYICKIYYNNIFFHTCFAPKYSLWWEKEFPTSGKKGGSFSGITVCVYSF